MKDKDSKPKPLAHIERELRLAARAESFGRFTVPPEIHLLIAKILNRKRIKQNAEMRKAKTGRKEPGRGPGPL